MRGSGASVVLLGALASALSCSTSSTLGGSSASPASGPTVAGKYIATTTDGPGFLSITFLDSTHYSLTPQGCATASCAESGTYVESAGSLVLTNASTGTSTTYSFAVGQAGAATALSGDLHVLGGGGLLGDAGPGDGEAAGSDAGETDASDELHAGFDATTSLGGGDGGAALGGGGDGGTVLVQTGIALTAMQITLNGQSFSKWKVGLYTDSSFGTVGSEQAKLTAAHATVPLSLYLNYADFSNFVTAPDPNQHIADVTSLNKDNIQLVMAFQPTNAPFCVHPSISSTGSHGCRMTDLTGTTNATTLAAYYANIAAYADLLTQPLIFRFGSEMNANWDDWDYGYDKARNGPSAFVLALEFAHHAIVAKLHKNTVLFAFAPNNVSYDGSTFAADIRAFWPGSGNIDLISLDGYTTTAGHTFSSDFGTQLTELEALGSQDLMLAEFACATTTQGKGKGSLVNRETWLDGAVAVLAKHPRVHYMNWFDNDLSHTYALGDRDSAGQSLYARFARDILGGTTDGSP